MILQDGTGDDVRRRLGRTAPLGNVRDATIAEISAAELTCSRRAHDEGRLPTSRRARPAPTGASPTAAGYLGHLNGGHATFAPRGKSRVSSGRMGNTSDPHALTLCAPVIGVLAPEVGAEASAALSAESGFSMMREVDVEIDFSGPRRRLRSGRVHRRKRLAM